MEVLKVTLKQHTPLIHFQHYEKGATLRASEVKPKLDKFIIEKLGNGCYEEVKQSVKEQYNEYFIDKDGIYSLNYKLQICPISGPRNAKFSIPQKPETKFKDGETYYLQSEYPMILSNMGGKTDVNQLVNFSYYDYIQLNFITKGKNPDRDADSLACVIQKYIVHFFANNNFGQRNDKGFGSFTVSSIISPDGTQKAYIWKTEYLPENTRLLQYDVDNNMSRYDTVKELFNVIDYYWKFLKSGINYTKRNKSDNGITRSFSQNYHKAFLYEYLDNKGATWEKRIVKTQLNLESKKAAGDPIQIPNDNPYFFARAHLGCPVNGITYKVMKGTFHLNRKGKMAEDTDTVDVTISNDNGIERIPSPVIFKPVFFQVIREDKKTQRKIRVNVAAVYILFNNDLIRYINNLNDTNFDFTNKKNKKTVTVPLFARDRNDNRITIDYHELISDFHRSLGWKMVPIDYKGSKILNNREIRMYVVKSTINK